MNQKKFNELMHGFLTSLEGEAAIGQIMLSAIAQSMTREMTFEDATSQPGRVIAEKRTVNVLDQLVTYMPHIEAAIRGCQSDAAQARNRSANTRDLLLGICRAASDKGLELLPDETHPQIGEGKNHA